MFVLGHRGMLGHVVSRYLRERGVDIMQTDQPYEGSREDRLVSAVRESDAEWVVNAAGKFDSTNSKEMLLVNSQLPAHLKCAVRRNQRVIHASSDGVFSGRTGNYGIDAHRDATDDYGFSKILGEVIAETNKATVIRTSIIGPGGAKGGGLINWLLKQRGPIDGFTNHHWNGITTLEWAKVCYGVMTGSLTSIHGVLQPTSAEAVTKYQILKLVAHLWNHPVEVNPSKAPVSLNRTLTPEPMRGSLLQQLQELKRWY